MFGWTTAELFIRHFIRQPEHGEGQRAHKLLIMVVGVAGFEPATPSSRTRCASQFDQRLTNDIRELKANIRERSNRVRTGKALKMVGPGGVPSHCNSNELFCPADANAGFEIKKQFPELSSPPEAASLVSYDAGCRALAEAHPRPMPGRREQSDAHGRMPSRRRPRARLRGDRQAFVYDGDR